MKFSLYFMLFIVCFNSCANKKQSLDQSISIGNLVNEYAFTSKAYDTTILPKNLKTLDSFYTATTVQSIWFDDSLLLNKTGDNFINILHNANQYGLDPKQYSVDKIQRIYHIIKESKTIKNRKELASLLGELLTKNYFIFGKHLNYGLIENVDILTTLSRKEFVINMPDYLLMAYKKDSVIDYLLALQPSQDGYKKLQKGMVKFLQSSTLSKERAKVNTYKVDSLKAIAQSKKALVIHSYIPENSTDTIFIRGLRKFQYEHGLKPDGIIGANTAYALSKSPYEYYQSAAASLERWRWKPSWGKDYIYVNIPAYRLWISLGDTLKIEHKVVVGKLRNKTPEVYSKLSYIAAYPYWHVPTSISVNEVLVKQKKDSNYMTRNNYEVFTKKLEPVSIKQINWDTVNRSNFNFYFRQRGGSSNALGLVKFIFYNKYSIYLHDTPTKYHFNREIRAFSHGCIRVQDAMQLADNVLRYDENLFSIDSVYSYVEKRNEKKMMLTKKLPVYIQYIVCDTDKDNTIIFYRDIYKKDNDVIRLLFDNQLVK